MCLSQIPQIIADKPQEPQNPNLSFSAKYAACCIPLRDLRYLRENIHIRVLNQFTNKKPQCLPQISLITQTKPKTTTTSQTVFLCEIMQLAAFLCVICVICGRIFTQEYSIYCTKKPQYLPQISLIYADKPQNNTNDKLSFSAI